MEARNLSQYHSLLQTVRNECLFTSLTLLFSPSGFLPIEVECLSKTFLTMFPFLPDGDVFFLPLRGFFPLARTHSSHQQSESNILTIRYFCKIYTSCQYLGRSLEGQIDSDTDRRSTVIFRIRCEHHKQLDKEKTIKESIHTLSTHR